MPGKVTSKLKDLKRIIQSICQIMTCISVISGSLFASGNMTHPVRLLSYLYEDKWRGIEFESTNGKLFNVMQDDWICSVGLNSFLGKYIFYF